MQKLSEIYNFDNNDNLIGIIIHNFETGDVFASVKRNDNNIWDASYETISGETITRKYFKSGDAIGDISYYKSMYEEYLQQKEITEELTKQLNDSTEKLCGKKNRLNTFLLGGNYETC